MQDHKRAGNDLRLFDLLSEIEELADQAAIPSVLASLLDSYGLKSIAYLGTGVTGGPDAVPYLAVTYSHEWVEHYKRERFVEIDPAVQIGMRRMIPINWDTFDRSDERVKRLFGEATEFGYGRHGLSFPVHGQYGDRALVSITSNATDREWHNLHFYFMRDFQLLALHLHEAILRLEGGAKPRVKISPRERECLMWIAEGKTAWECALILGLSEHTVRCYLESARHKLGAANNSHAVNKAGKANLLTQLP